MRRFWLTAALSVAAALSVFSATAQAALTPVTGTMTVSAHARAGTQTDVYGNDSRTTTLSGYIHAEAMSTDMGDPVDPGDPSDPGDPWGNPGDPVDPWGDPGMMPYSLSSMSSADAMADASITQRGDGFALAGFGHSGVNEGPGHSDVSITMNFTFSLDQQSSCAIVADNHFEFVVGTEAVSASIYLQNAAGQKLLELNNPLQHYEGTLTLDAGQYTVVGNLNSITIAEYSSTGTIWDGSGLFGMDLTATAVPEPMTVTLLGLGGLLALRKRK